MIQRMSHISVFVTDHNAAIDFYVNKLGFELKNNQDLPGFRWVTVAPKGQTEMEIILFKHEAGRELTQDDVGHLQDLMKKGAFGAAVLITADCRKTYEELTAKGVRFASPPQEKFYGIEAIMHDPFGNWFSLSQPK